MKKSTVWLLGILNMIGPFTFDSYVAALPQMAKDLNTNAAGTQATILAHLIGMTLGMLFLGTISDTVGRRKPILVSIAVYLVSAFAIAFITSIQVIIILRLFQGLASGALVAVSQAVIRDRTDGTEMAKSFSLMLMIRSIAPILAPAIGAVFLVVGNWRTIFEFLGVYGVGLLLWAMADLKESLPENRRLPLTIGSTAKNWGSIFRDRLFISASIATFCITFGLYAYLSNGTFVMQEDFHLTPLEFSLNLSMVGGAVLVSRFANNALISRFEFKRVYRMSLDLGLVTSAIFIGSLFFPGNLYFFTAGLLGMSFTMGFIGPNALNLALTNHKKNAGSASGLAGLIGTMAGLISTAIVSHVVGSSAFGLALYIAIPFLLASISRVTLASKT